MELEKYNFMVTVIATLFAFFSVALTYFGYVKFKLVDKIVQKKLDDEMFKFVNNLQEEMFNTQNAAAKIEASYKYFETNEIDKAIELLTEAASICPKAYNLYNTLGYAYMKKNDMNTAKLMFQRAIELHPHNIQGYNDMANLCMAIKDEAGYKHYYAMAIKNVDNAADKWQDIHPAA